MCQLPPKMPNMEKKKPKIQRIFLTPTTCKKAKFVKFGVKKSILATLSLSARGMHGTGAPKFTAAGVRRR